MSAAVTTTKSSQGTAGSKVMPVMRPRATGLRTVTPWSIPAGATSSTYSAWPVTFARPSLRSTDRPICGPSIGLILACLLDGFGSFERTVGSVQKAPSRFAAAIRVHRDGAEHRRSAGCRRRLVVLPLVDLAVPIGIGFDAIE